MGMFDHLLAEDEASKEKPSGGMFDHLLKEEPAKPEKTWVDTATGTAKAALSGLERGAVGIAGLPGDLQNISRAIGTKRGFTPPKRSILGDLPTSEKVIDTVSKWGVPGLDYKPQTTAERVARMATEMVPGALIGPGGMAAKALKYGVIPGTAVQGVNEIAPNAPAWVAPAAGVVTAILGGLHGRPTVAQQAVTGAIKGASPTALDAAEKLIQNAKSMGVDLSRAEALQQVSGGFNRMGNLQRVVEGQGGMDKFYANRPAQIEGAVSTLADTMAPATDRPSLIGKRVGEAAKDIVSEAHAARTERSSPFYKAAAQNNVPPHEVGNIIRQIDDTIASDKTGLLHEPLKEVRDSLVAVPSKATQPATRVPVVDQRTGTLLRYEHTPAVPGSPEQYVTSVEDIDRARKYFREITKLPAFAPKAIEKETGARINNLLGQLDDIMEKRSVPFRLAKTAHQQASRSVVEPVEAGPVGKLSAIAEQDTDLTKKARNALFPSSPEAGSHQEIADAVSELAKKEPVAARQLVRSHIENTFNEAARELQSGENQYGGATFRAKLIGNPQQKKNLEAAINALPGGADINKGMDILMDVMGATGKRQRIGSQTAFNADIQDRLKSGLLSKEAASILMGAGVKWPTAVWDRLRLWNLGHNTEEIARLLTDPEAAAEFKALANAPTSSARAARALARLTYLAERTPDKRHERASGGRVGKRDYPAKRMTLLEREAVRAHRDISERTKPIMDMPDEEIANALRLAKH